MSKFVGNVYKCSKCGGLMQSQYSGHFVSCSCKSCFIDETWWYVRVGTGQGASIELVERNFTPKMEQDDEDND